MKKSRNEITLNITNIDSVDYPYPIILSALDELISYFLQLHNIDEKELSKFIKMYANYVENYYKQK